jgi:hypothetical protein
MIKMVQTNTVVIGLFEIYGPKVLIILSLSPVQNINIQSALNMSGNIFIIAIDLNTDHFATFLLMKWFGEKENSEVSA